MAVNGIDTSAAAAAVSKAKNDKTTSGNSSLDKDAFLQLLVTQMQYQDPLEPTDNTEYMSQLAQFSELESMNNLSSSFSKSQALGLVGQYVILNTTNASGAQTQVAGLVQYVTVKDNQALLCVNDKYYTMDEFDSVVDYDYVEYMQNKDAEKAAADSGKTDSATDTNDQANQASANEKTDTE